MFLLPHSERVAQFNKYSRNVIIHHPRIRKAQWPHSRGWDWAVTRAPVDSDPGVPILGETCELWMERRVMVIDIVAIISILGLGLHSDHRTDRLPTDIRWDRAGASHPSYGWGSVSSRTLAFSAAFTRGLKARVGSALAVVLHHTTITFYRLGMRIIILFTPPNGYKSMKRPGGWLVLRSSDSGNWVSERGYSALHWPRPVFCCNNGFWGKSLQGPPPAPGPCRFILGLQSTLLRMIGLVMVWPGLWRLHCTLLITQSA